MKIFILGFMGAGKSHWGRKLSTGLQLPLIDLDKEIESREGLSIPAIFEKYGEEHFRKLEHIYLKELAEKERVLISCGGGTPCYSGNMNLMNTRGLTIWLNVPAEVMANRLKRSREDRPLLKGFNDDQLLDFVKEKLKEREPFYDQAKIVVNPIKYTVTTLTEKIKSCIEHS